MATEFGQSFKVNMIKEISIPASTLGRWQEIVDLMVEAIEVPVGLIVQGHPRDEIELLVRSQNPENIYYQQQASAQADVY